MDGNLEKSREYYVEKFVKCPNEKCQNGFIPAFTNERVGTGMLGGYSCSYCYGTGFKKVMVKEAR